MIVTQLVEKCSCFQHLCNNLFVDAFLCKLQTKTNLANWLIKLFTPTLILLSYRYNLKKLIFKEQS